MLEAGKDTLRRTPVVGRPIYAGLHALKAGVKDALSPQELFADLGLKYFGPVDGHDVAAMESALRRARHFGGPVIVHAVTRKGCGYPPAENDDAEQMHCPAAFDPATGLPHGAHAGGVDVACSPRRWWRSGTRGRDVVAITAAMLGPTGLAPFAEAFPDRCFDVGIAEQHALTSAAGLAAGGLHPVVAIYSTFLNRAFDQLLMDVALHRLAVTLVLDRAGVTGDDGPVHNGMWDLSILGVVPGHAGGRAAGRRDPARGAGRGRRGRRRADGAALPEGRGDRVGAGGAPDRRGGRAARARPRPSGRAGGAAGRASGRSASSASRRPSGWPRRASAVTVVDPRWVLPVPDALVGLAAGHRLVVTVEDSGRHGGFGSALADALRAAECDVPLRDLALPQQFLEHGNRADLLADLGLTAQDVARRVTEWARGAAGFAGSAWRPVAAPAGWTRGR